MTNRKVLTAVAALCMVLLAAGVFCGAAAAAEESAAGCTSANVVGYGKIAAGDPGLAGAHTEAYAEFKHIVKGVEVKSEIESGESIRLVGDHGSGKTTLQNLMPAIETKTAPIASVVLKDGIVIKRDKDHGKQLGPAKAQRVVTVTKAPAKKAAAKKAAAKKSTNSETS